MGIRLVSSTNNSNTATTTTSGTAAGTHSAAVSAQNAATTVPPPSIGVDEEAKQWNTYVDTLKATVDSMYELCAARQNLLGCEEALIYLTNAARDFQSLISSINVELEWENSENRSQPIAWVVKGATHRKGGLLSPRETNTENDAATQTKELTNEQSCVKCRTKRRITSDPNDDENNKKIADVYERLAYGKRSNVGRPASAVHATPMGDLSYAAEMQEPAAAEELRKNGCVSGRLMTPRSAMDIPQTKSSMAKIAASRQLLWQRHKKILTEKLSAKRRQEQTLATLGNRRRSLPILAKQPATTSAKSAAVAELNLESIREAAHEEDRNELGAANEADNSSTKTHAGHFTTRSDGFPLELLDINNDNEWLALTEEEESLAQEEESLKKEIEEEESISIDEELQRRVTLDFGDVNVDSAAKNLGQSWQSVVDEWTVEGANSGGDGEDELMRDVATETPKPTEQQQQQQENLRFRRPGQAAQVHQRLLSPMKRKNTDVEVILERQTKAEELRLFLQEQKAQRLRHLHSKVEEVRRKREELLEKQRLHLEKKMQKANENRQRNLEEIIKRMKDENTLKLLEVSYVKEMGLENVRLEVKSREQDREQRLLSLAEERQKSTREKVQREAALEERRKIADQQRAEWLREQALRNQERHFVAEIQRSELLEQYRKKGQQWERKLENKKMNELLESANLRNKIQEKHERGIRRYEESVESVRQRAIDSSTPRPLNAWTSLADCSSPPSDLRYFSPGGAMCCCRKCIPCDYMATSDLDLITHLLSSEHLMRRELGVDTISFAYLRDELENNVTQVAEECQQRTEAEEQQQTTPTNGASPNKKLRTKLKQKLGAVTMPADIGASTLSPNAKQSFEKKAREFRNQLQHYAKAGEQQKLAVERSLADLRRLFLAQPAENTASLCAVAHQIGLIGTLMEFIIQNPIDDHADASSKPLSRLISKTAHFLTGLFAANARVSCALLFSAHLYPLLEWTNSHVRHTILADAKLQRQPADEILAAFCVLLVLVEESSKFVRGEHPELAPNLNDRLRSMAAYWANSSFPALYKHFIANGVEPMTIGFDLTLRPLVVLSGVLEALLAALQSGEKQESPVLGLYLGVARTLITETYAKVRADPVATSVDGANTVTSSNPMTSSLISTTSSSNWPANVSVEVECATLVRLWNALHARAAALNAPARRKVQEAVEQTICGDMVVRFVYLLIASLHNGGKALPLELAKESSSREALSLSALLNAISHFAAISPHHRALCTIGWQKSLLLHVCKLPFEHYQNPAVRPRLLSALIVILFENRGGVELSRDHISPSWMAEFLKELLNAGDNAAYERETLKRVFPEEKWRCALQYFAGNSASPQQDL